MLQQLTSFAATYSYTTTTTTDAHMSLGAFLAIYGAALVVSIFLIIIPLWKIFQKAGKPGWAAIVPVYNTWVLFEIVGYPGWWALLSFIPFVNIFPAIMSIVAYFKLAKLFGKSDVFAVLTILFPFVCLPILAYGDAAFHANGSQGGDMSSGAPVTPDAPAAPAEAAAPAPSPEPVPAPPAPVAPEQPTTVAAAPEAPQAPASPEVPSASVAPAEAPTQEENDQTPPATPPTPTVG